MSALRTATGRSTSPYSFEELEKLWISAGGSRAQASIAAAVALAESKGDPNAINHNSNGSIDRGLWQINTVHGSLSTTNVDANARAAVRVQKESGWGAWTTYNTGAYKGYLNSNSREGLEDLGLAPGPHKEESLSSATLKALGAVKSSGQAYTNAPGEAAKSLIDSMTSKWLGLGLTLILILAGGLLLIYGIAVAVRPRESALSFPKMPAVVPV